MKQSLAKQALHRILSNVSKSDHDLANTSEAELLLMALMQDLQNLSKIQSTEARITYQRAHLHQYEAWVMGIINHPDYDRIAIQMLVWSVDCDDYSLMLRLLAWAITNKHALPQNFTRTPLTFIVDEICAKSSSARTNNSDFPLPILEQVFNLSVESLSDDGKRKHYDMPDVVLSNLYKEIGLNPATEPTLALDYLKESDRINPKSSGVKNKIKALEKQLNESDPAD